MPTALALSPHLDDAVFSAGGLIGRLADDGWRVVVATMFTRSVPQPTGFALACQLDKGLAAGVDYMALRREEDRRACTLLGAVPVWLDFAEAPHRGYTSAAALFASPLAADGIAAPLARAITPLIADTEPELLLAPQCIGGHVDHIMTWRALRECGSSRPTLWWRDFPYDLRPGQPEQPLAREHASLAEAGATFDRARKQRACEAYASQLGFQFGDRDGVARMIKAGGGRERFRLDGVPSLDFLSE